MLKVISVADGSSWAKESGATFLKPWKTF